MATVIALLGSVTPPGRLSSAVAGAVERATAAGHPAKLLDLGTLRVGFADGRPVEQFDDDTTKLVAAMTSAEAVILATPVYRGTLTGALKNALDLLPIEALQGKPVGIVAMGATLHHYLGAESHLRDILGWFGALTLPTAIYLSSADFQEGVLTETGRTALDELFAAAAALAEATPNRPLGPAPLAGAPRKG